MNEQRLELLPITAQVVGEGAAAQLSIAGCDLAALAAEYGTPLYLYDQASLDGAAAAYRGAQAAHYPGTSGITFAGKAFLNLAFAQWVEQQGMLLDCTGAGELYVAKAAGVARDQVLVHGVNKSAADLDAAVAQAGTIVVDNLTELRRLAERIPAGTDNAPQLWLRVRPGVAVDTHAYRQTGQEDSKFGVSLAEAVEAVRYCQQQQLRLTGIHFHQGSHFHDPEPIAAAVETVLDLLVALRQQSGWLPSALSTGGGWGVAYHEEDLPQPSIEQYVAFIAHHLVSGCQQRDLPLPQWYVEPGRSIVARGGVALYRVGNVKYTANRRWLMIDGGLADNPRPALYGARYSALPVSQPLRANQEPAWLAGPFCESGDVMIEALPMPAVQTGELLVVPAAGAYHLAMGSNYNGACRPAVLWLRAGQAHLIQRRERVEELTRRDLLLPK